MRIPPARKPAIREILGGVLVAIGLIQVAGYLAKSPKLRGLGTALASSPLPIVFTQVRGLETFASGFELEYRGPDGQKHVTPITPREYSRLGGPYNWRNVYGAAISYGPVLPQPLWRSVLVHGFCDEGPLAKALGAGRLDQATVTVRSGTAGRSDSWRLDVECRP